jgi:uncharacterized membrane protein YfcA
MFDSVLLPVLFLAAALLYSSVGHGGASAYLAIMALVGTAPEVMRPVALILNVFVAGLATWRFSRAGYLRVSLLAPLVVASIPCAALGATMTLSAPVYHRVLGAVLIFSAIRLWWSATSTQAIVTRRLPMLLALPIGGAIGFLSGLVGVGGGIFLSPVLILMRWANPKETSAVSAAFIAVNSIAGLAGCMKMIPQLPGGVLIWGAAALAGGAIGSWMGSKRLPNPRLRQVLAIVLVVASVKLFWKDRPAAGDLPVRSPTTQS